MLSLPAMQVSLCVCVLALLWIPATIGTEVYDSTTVPNTPLCYHYNRTQCLAARLNTKVSAERRAFLCSSQVLPCKVPLTGHSTCITVWEQNINDTHPNHTDNTLEKTVYQSCFPKPFQEEQLCGASCVADESGREVPEDGTSMVTCCCREPLCNGHDNRLLNITLREKPENSDVDEDLKAIPSKLRNTLIYSGVAIGLLMSLMLLLFIVYMRRRHKQLPLVEDMHSLDDCSLLEEANLTQADLSLQAEIAQGRYAKVYQGGELNGVPVAIKCFTAANRRMWQQERDIYNLLKMSRNDNIARYFGSLHNGTGNDMTMWIVVEYYPNGSIYDYLKGHTLTWPVMLKLTHSMMKGLAFLHDELTTCDGQRTCMAHRDIKSKNILIKDDMTAAIADFGLAQCFKDGTVNESHAQFQAGTHRYMAPEVLDGAISFTKDSFLRIDVYAAALVMWELLTRCDVSENHSSEYKAPYEDMEVGRHCSLLETLQVLVSKEKKRPSFPDCLYRNTHTSSLIATIEESWDADAEARLSAGCIQARLERLLATVANDTDVNNMRNLEPPPYYSRIQATDEASSLLIAYT